MFRVIEVLGLAAPLLGAAMVLYYRRRLGRAFGPAAFASVLAVLGSLTGLITGKAMWFGSGGTEAVTHRMEFGAGVRNLLLVAAWALLVIAALRRPARRDLAR